MFTFFSLEVFKLKKDSNKNIDNSLPNEFKTTFPKRLKKLRKLKNLSQEELAFNLDISRTHLSNLEAGNATPSLNLLISIANYFNCSYDYLLNRISYPDEYKPISNNIFDLLNDYPEFRFDDFEVSEEDKDKIISAIKHALSIVRLYNKEKKG